MMILQTPQSARNRIIDRVLICLFLAALLTPLVLWSFRADVFFSEAEKRELQHFPVVTEQGSVTEFTKKFDNYFQDHFGMREWLIRRYQREASKRFGVSGVPDVLVGLEDWLYLFGTDMPDDLQGKLRFSDQEQALFWQQLQKTRAWMQEQGAAYIFVVAPNKQSIYPEYLPEYFQVSQTASRLDQLLASQPLGETEGILDTRTAIRRDKSKVRLYDKTDTHWNAQGAYLAYQAILARSQSLFPEQIRQPEFSFALNWADGPGGDLAVMRGEGDSVIEQRPVLETGNFSAIPRVISQELQALLTTPPLKVAYTVKDKRPLRVLVLHDSFFEKLKPFVSETYGSVLYIWRFLDEARKYPDTEELKQVVALYKPDLVIDEIVERNLSQYLPLKTTPEK